MLTKKALDALRPNKDKPYKRSDEKGLHVLVRPDGAMYWRFKYRYAGTEKLLALGVYRTAKGRPGDVDLKRAREKRDDARKLLDRGIDPSAERKAEKAAQADTFEAVAREWLAKGCPPRKKNQAIASATIEQLRTRLEQHCFRHMGSQPVATLTAPDLLRVLRRIEDQGTHETAHRVRSVVGRVLRYAVATGRAERDISADLGGALVPVETRNRPAITKPERFGDLLRRIDAYEGQPATVAALRLLPLVFTRPGELRLATWGEIDLDGAQWSIPGKRMKMRRDHIVPLSRQAVAILADLARLTERGPDSYVFPSLRPSRPLSDNTLNVALRALDVDTKAEHCAHGFRSTASTLLHETGWDSQTIELQLAHTDKNRVRAIYNRAERLAERVKLMQAWADYCDGLKADDAAKVVALHG